MECAGDGIDALLSSARWLESEESMRRVRGVICHGGGFADAAVVVKDVDGGREDPSDLLSCSHNPP